MSSQTRVAAQRCEKTKKGSFLSHRSQRECTGNARPLAEVGLITSPSASRYTPYGITVLLWCSWLVVLRKYHRTEEESHRIGGRFRTPTKAKKVNRWTANIHALSQNVRILNRVPPKANFRYSYSHHTSSLYIAVHSCTFLRLTLDVLKSSC